MEEFGNSIGCPVFIEEQWRLEIDREGGAKITIDINFKNLSDNEQHITGPYKLQFRAEEQPTDFQYNGHTITDNSIPLNLTIPPNNTRKITVDLRYDRLANRGGSWWDISLAPRYGAFSPLKLTIECYFPMDAEEILFRNKITEDFLIDHIHNTAVITYNGPPFYLKIAYTLESLELVGDQFRSMSENDSTLSEEDISSFGQNMPILQQFAATLSADNQPFSGKSFLILLHFLKDLIIFLESLEKLGLAPEKAHLFWKPYIYPHKDLIIKYLKSKGYNVYPLNDLESVIATQQDAMDNIIILEDGGYIVTLLHSGFEPLINKTIGAVEQTTKGIRRDLDVGSISIPILSVAEAEIKKKLEPPFVADAAIRNIETLISEPLRGKKIALMGLGVIGNEILNRLIDKGANVTAYDLDELRRVSALNMGISTEREAYRAVKDKFLVVGCSGETSIVREGILALKHRTYLVSTSSDQVEIDMAQLDALSNPNPQPLKNPVNGAVIGKSYILLGSNNEVRLLADGYPVNFWCSDSLPNEISDVILSAILLSAFEIVKNRSDFQNGIQNVDALLKKYKLAKIYEERYAM